MRLGGVVASRAEQKLDWCRPFLIFFLFEIVDPGALKLLCFSFNVYL